MARLLFALVCLTASWGAAAQEVAPAHGIAMHGDLKYGPDFQHFEYADPDAPKGGEVRYAAIGGFDSLNPYILKGEAAAGLGNLYETLMTSSADEAFSEYGLIAESIETPPDRSWAIFTLRPEARWHDGTPITVEDVIFSFTALRDQGAPFYRYYYRDVTSVEAVGERRVKFTFGGEVNRELPLIVGQMPVLPKHDFATKPFDQTTLEPPLGSGPYRVAAVDPGRSITYERVPDWWGKDLAVNRGRYNVDRIQYDYYRDPTIALEAFKAHEFDLRVENVSKQWAIGYDGPALAAGLIVKEEIPNELPNGMQGFVFNTRLAKFSDRRVRQALALPFDFEWVNKNLFFGAYTRTNSYFANSELAAVGEPSAAELALLEPFRASLPAEVFGPAYQAPASDGSGGDRANLRAARAMLAEAGWTVRDGALVGPDGAPMTIEFMIDQPAFERVTAAYIQNLERLGIEATIRQVDSSQYEQRMEDFDFDVVVATFGQSLSPGNEQRNYWSSAAADMAGSSNIIGIKDPAVDALIEAIIAAPDREALVTATRALDRVLTWGHYVVPHWHLRASRIAYWNKFSRPAIDPKYGVDIDAWWVDPAKEAALAEKETALE
jgi:microcin C transport system substrate-binding protein